MTSYVKDMINCFDENLKDDEISKTPSSNDLFSDSKGPLLDDKRRELFHKIVAKGLFVSKRAQLDIHGTISILCTRVQQPRELNWHKLKRLIKYLNGTNDMV